MLLVLVFNFIGYKFLIQYLENQSTVLANKKIETFNYAEGDLVEVTVPLQMPYYNDSRQEIIEGEIIFGGITYNYVKRQVKNNILHIWCLPNFQKTKLDKLNRTIAKSSDNANSSDATTSLSISKILDTDYEVPTSFSINSNPIGYVSVDYLITNIECKSLFTPQKTIKPPSLV